MSRGVFFPTPTLTTVDEISNGHDYVGRWLSPIFGSGSWGFGWLEGANEAGMESGCVLNIMTGGLEDESQGARHRWVLSFRGFLKQLAPPSPNVYLLY